MPKTRFEGRVLPAALHVSIPNRPKFAWKADDLDLQMAFQIQIRNGAISIDCDVNKFEAANHFVPLFVRAYDIARATVDLIAFGTGGGLTMVLETFLNPEGAVIPLATQHPSLAAFATAAPPGSAAFDKILEILLAEPPLFLAMRDLIEAITAPHRAAVNCRRALRFLSAYFGSRGTSPGVTGSVIRERLQIDNMYLLKILWPLRPSEDEVGVPVTESASIEIIDRLWVVMNRFLEYRKRGSQPLPLSEFPLLV